MTKRQKAGEAPPPTKQQADRTITEGLTQDSDINTNQVLIEPLTSNEQPRYPSLSLPGRHLAAAQAATTTVNNSLQVTDVFGNNQPNQLAQGRKALTLEEVSQILQVQDPLTDRIENPYTILELWRMHDTYRRDGTARRSLNLLADFTLGDRTMHVLDVTQEYATKQEHDAAQKALQSNKDAQDDKQQLDKINRQVNFDHWLTAAFIQCKVFGRAVLVIQDDPQTGLPVALKMLSSMRLGRIFVNEVSWKIEGVEYLDYHGMQSIIPADKMIYFTSDDFGISPNTLGMGLSAFEVIMDISETNRSIREMDIKELNRSLWAPFIIMKVNTKKRSVMQAVKNQLKVGVPFIHNLDATLEVHRIEQTPVGLLTEAKDNDHTIGRHVGVLTFMLGFEDFPNRSTAQSTLDAWTKSVLSKLRTWLRGIIEPQWIDRNLAKLKNIDVKVVSELPYKIKMDFETFTVQDLHNDAAAVDLLVNDNIIDTQKARDVMGMSDIDERMAAQDAVKQAQQKIQTDLTMRQLTLQESQQRQQSQTQQSQPTQLAQTPITKTKPRSNLASAANASDVNLKKIEVLDAIKRKAEREAKK